ncbi:MAG: cyclic nucleotide-binding domain-containing protein [Syntrophobacteraceae bacterium]
MAENECKDHQLLEATIFRDLPCEELDKILHVVEKRVVPRGGVIFKVGDPGDGFYIIHSGKVRIYRKKGAGVERELSILGPGESFGEISLITGEPRSANAEALEETHLLVLPKEHFDRILREYPSISATFMKEMRRWLITDHQLIEDEAEVAYKATRTSWLDFVVIIGLSVILAVIFNQSSPNGISLFPEFPDPTAFTTVKSSAIMESYEKGETLILDAMPVNFYQKRHIKGAVSMPLSLFDIVYMMTFEEEDMDRPIVIYGRTLSRMYDLELAGKLINRGYRNVRILEGDISGWVRDGHPVEESTSK